MQLQVGKADQHLSHSAFEVGVLSGRLFLHAGVAVVAAAAPAAAGGL